MPIECNKIVVKGRVQGVFFRASTLKKAKHFAIKGTVRNTSAGDVEIIALGEQQAMQQFIQWCHKGPIPPKVTAAVIVEPLKDAADYTEFTIL
ncbi:acylphosphatase [Methylococcaceae bacterium HT4]|nr:acylphosphatase [Methylococcaceae bacterium HT4]TXL21367.1 acylphosphatase [Methylococcaceae bacterium HT5]